jgi:hypothetical protein
MTHILPSGIDTTVETETETKVEKPRFGIAHLATVATALVVMCLGALEAYMALNIADDFSSFLFGPVTVALTALMVGALVLGSSDRTSTTTGTVIGIVTAVCAVLIFTWWRPFENLDGGSLFFGVVGGLSIVIAACSITFANALYFHKKNSPAKPVVSDMHTPESTV